MVTEPITTELIAIITVGVSVGVAVIGVGVTLAGLIIMGQRSLRSEMRAQREETQAQFQAQQKTMVKVLERVAHVEGLLGGLREAVFGRRMVPAERETAVGAVAEDPEQYKR